MVVHFPKGQESIQETNFSFNECMEWISSSVETQLNCNDKKCDGIVNFTVTCINENCQARTSLTITECQNSVVTDNNVINETLLTLTPPQPHAIPTVCTSTPDATITTTGEREDTQLTTMKALSSTNEECVTTITGLGAVVGLLVVLLAAVTTGWVWTCWIMKKRGGIIINSKQVR